MKYISMAIISFLLGAALTGVIAYKFFMELSYHTALGHLSDNLSYYEKLEQNNPEQVQYSISSSLSFYILILEEGNQSFWISPQNSALQILSNAKELQHKIAVKQPK